MRKINIDKLRENANIYSKATDIKCRAMKMESLQKVNKPARRNICSFCKFVHNYKDSWEDCRQSYLYGGLQAEKLGEYYIYFCPYGLVNWTVPVINNNSEMEYFLVGGPVLLHPVDELLIDDITKQNPLFDKKKKEIMGKLQEIKVIDTGKARYLAKLLLLLAKGIMQEEIIKLEEKKQVNDINSRMAEVVHDLKNEDQDTLYPFDKEKELIEKVKSGDKIGARETLNDILGHIYFQSGGKFRLMKSKAIELMTVLARAAIEVGADLEIIFGLEYMYFEKINEVTELEELSNRLIKVLDRFIECSFTIKNIKNKDLIFKAMSYIRSNYNNDISLKDVASEVGLSSSYFSKLFKEELSLTYSEYLNKVRINASKDLLKGDYTLAEIAQQIGFNDQSYFSRVFKNIEGVTPGKWNSI